MRPHATVSFIATQAVLFFYGATSKMKTVSLTHGLVTIVSDEDFEVLSKYSWHAVYIGKSSGGKKKWYAERSVYLGGGRKNSKIKHIKMHREIMKAIRGEFIDHIDGDSLNNQRSNLRFCNHSQNMANIKCKTKNPYRGISVCPNGKWKAQISVKGKNKIIGRFRTPEAAAIAYDAKAKELFGEFARLNFEKLVESKV